MDIFIVTNGLYSDKTNIGVATSLEQAEQMIERARASGAFDSHDYYVEMPLTPGEIVRWDGKRI